MQMGTNKGGVTNGAGECAFSEPWIADSSVFKNIDDDQSNLVDIRHSNSVGIFWGAINGLLFKTTSGAPLGLDTYCDP